jgi:hypothetical protein
MIAFFFATWVGRIILSVFGLIVLAVALSGTLFGLAISGGPGDCEPGGGPIVVSDAMSDSFQQKWDAFEAMLDAGSPASVTFNESEVTSRAVTWIRDEGGPDFNDARICIHDGFGEATGTLRGLGLDVEFKITGSVELTQSQIVAHIDDIDIGNIQDPFHSWFEGQAEDPIEEGLDDLGLGSHTYTVTLTEGSVTIDGEP